MHRMPVWRAGSPSNPTAAQRATLLPLLSEAVRQVARSALGLSSASKQFAALKVQVASGRAAGSALQLRVVGLSGRAAAEAVGTAMVRAVQSGALGKQLRSVGRGLPKELSALKLAAARFSVSVV